MLTLESIHNLGQTILHVCQCHVIRGIHGYKYVYIGEFVSRAIGFCGERSVD
jgi:hypothetical protein